MAETEQCTDTDGADTGCTGTDRLYTPLRAAACGVSLRFFADRGGQRCAVGFTSLDRLVALLGEDQRYYRLTERAVRELARERGVTALIVDPGLVAAPVREPEPVAVPAPANQRQHHHEGLLRRVGAFRSAFDGQAAGILTVSAITGAAAAAMQVLK